MHLKNTLNSKLRGLDYKGFISLSIQVNGQAAPQNNQLEAIQQQFN
ncbi:hypothetical protein BTN50_0122 [Candidatus Enterovibrio altilux]|uniref:Uncharacterized protein n=1 Tax=Candidatus Enterovibrio altilux TaxID=1927128 RepID=A0A291B6Q4_9GAMM|nr:hypothetical protein BTN50_0122 [Candidatus Enterovibrio luxaltus]